MYDILDKSGGIFASPTPSDILPGHFLTALDIYGKTQENRKLSAVDDELKKLDLI